MFSEKYNLFFFIIALLFNFFLCFFYKKNSILLDQVNSSSHKKFATIKKTPLTGGALIITFLFLFLKLENNIIFFILLYCIFGTLSDLNIVKSAKLKFLVLTFLTIFFVIFIQLKIISIGFFFMDQLLLNNLFNIFFTVFCIMVVINGTNFIDGINGLSIGYYLLINISLLIASHSHNLSFLNLETNLILLLALIIPNIFKFSFLGDAGVFSLSSYFCFLLISFHQLNPLITPFFIAALLWYPAFENLFSIFRKLIFNTNPLKPDNYHLHHLILKEILLFFGKRTNSFYAAVPIHLFNSIIFFLALKNINYQKNLIIIILFAILIYLIVYIYLIRRNVKVKKIY
jgi:UDP-N-acetylmuramyl pentapeptide phosphotransferase/UDP-N-acetylglucosamine-1-phosphate transferase